MIEAFIAGAVRTPLGDFNGSLSQVPSVKLGTTVIEESVKRAGLKPESVDSVYMSMALPAGLGASPVRHAALEAGLLRSVNTALIAGGASSSLQALAFAYAEVLSGRADTVIAGGMESVSRAPYLLDKARFGYRRGNGELVDSIISDGLRDSLSGLHAGEAAEAVARRYDIGRDEQDRWAEGSCRKAVEAQRRGGFDAEIVPITIPVGPDRFASMNSDEGPQKHECLRLSAVRPLFKDGGTVTSGNSSGVSDGASAVTVVSSRTLKSLGISPMARIAAVETAGSEPEISSVAPAEAIDKLLKKAGLKAKDIGLFEINEDFAVSMIAIARDLSIDPDRLNVRGGAVALGSPIAASGSRVLTTLLHAMADRGAKKGVAAASSVGGVAVAVLVERTA